MPEIDEMARLIGEAADKADQAHGQLQAKLLEPFGKLEDAVLEMKSLYPYIIRRLLGPRNYQPVF